MITFELKHRLTKNTVEAHLVKGSIREDSRGNLHFQLEMNLSPITEHTRSLMFMGFDTDDFLRIHVTAESPELLKWDGNSGVSSDWFVKRVSGFESDPSSVGLALWFAQ